jgi:hypothetical protein
LDSGQQKIETRLLAVLVLTCLVSTSSSTKSTELRPIYFNSRIGLKKTSFVCQESLFKKIHCKMCRPCVAFPATRTDYMLSADSSYVKSRAKVTE